MIVRGREKKREKKRERKGERGFLLVAKTFLRLRACSLTK